MDRGYQKEKFTCLSIKVSIAKRYRRFCKVFGKSQSMSLLAMMDFFEVNEVSPDERLGETVSSLKYQMKKRFNAVIAIIRDIEKNQTKPTTAMLQKLFEEAAREEEEEFDFGTPRPIDENEELKHYREGYHQQQKNYQDLRLEMEQLLERMEYVKSTFGKGHFKLDMGKDEYERLKQRV